MQPLTPRTSVEEPTVVAKQSWVHKLGALLLILVCFEVGVFLLMFPWMEYWDHNSIASFRPWMRDFWDSPYFRGALSGLGVVNIYIALGEAFRLRRPRPDRLKVSVL
jgi:hypothetical protein